MAFLLARLGLYLQPNHAELLSTIADLLTEQADAQNANAQNANNQNKSDDAQNYDAAIALREQLYPRI